MAAAKLSVKPEIRFDPGPINAYALEFVTVKLKQQAVSDAFKSASAKEGADLLYTNDLVPQFDIKRRTPTPMPTAVGEATLVFPLRSLPEWSLGGKSSGNTFCASPTIAIALLKKLLWRQPPAWCQVLVSLIPVI